VSDADSAPAGKEWNWVQTIARPALVLLLPLLRPTLEAYFDRSWKLGHITRA